MRKLVFFLFVSFPVLASYTYGHGFSEAVKDSDSEEKTGIDHPIVGKWEYVKTVLPDGSEVVDLVATEHFYSDGTLLFVNIWLNPQPLDEFSNTPEEIKANFNHAVGGIATFTIEEGAEKDKLSYTLKAYTDVEYIGDTWEVDIKVDNDTFIYYFNNGNQLIMKRCEPETSPNSGFGIESNVNDDIKIYPNPTNTTLTINTRSYGPYHIEIASMNGQLVFSRKSEGTNHQIDLSSFREGAYVITIRSNDLIAKRRIIKI